MKKNPNLGLHTILQEILMTCGIYDRLINFWFSLKLAEKSYNLNLWNLGLFDPVLIYPYHSLTYVVE